jgi:hypothetical protein
MHEPFDSIASINLSGITMNNFFKKIFGSKPDPEPKVNTPRKPKELSPKEKATASNEPYIAILSVDIDDTNPRNGSFELDWNEFFVAKLIRAGYVGKDDSQIIDQWFQDVCRHVVLETYEQYEAMNPKVRRKDRNDGRAEYS